jgi:hypothetical protein
MVCVALKPRWDKQRFEDMRKYVGNTNSSNSLLITNENDSRIGYYSGAEVVLVGNSKDKFDLDTALGIIKNSGNRTVYMFIVGIPQDELEQSFARNDTPFNFKLIKSYRARHNTPVLLWKKFE